MAFGRISPLLIAGLSCLTTPLVAADDWVAPSPRVERRVTRHEPSLTRRPLSTRFRVDQFGYPEKSPIDFVLLAEGALAPKRETVELHRVIDDALIATLETLPFRAGQIDELSGDRGSLGSLSNVPESGEYVLVLRDTGQRSHPFFAGKRALIGPLRAAERVFYFQRANFEKKAPHSCDGDKCWALPKTQLGKNQDSEARPVPERDASSPVRDLSGGHWDAGDTNKYVTFAVSAFDQILTAFERNPSAFGDDRGLPESNNGLPDILDETRITLDFLAKMQPPDLGGGVLAKVGSREVEAFPSLDESERFYLPGACPAATIGVAALFAHASRVFAQFPAQHDYATHLLGRAQKALAAFDTLPKTENCERGELTGGDVDRSFAEQKSLRTLAKIHLWLATHRPEFLPDREEEIERLGPFEDTRWGVYHPEDSGALVSLARDPACPPAIRERIVSRFLACLEKGETLRFDAENDLYGAFVDRKTIHWGSNQTRANHGVASLDGLLLAPLDRSEVLRNRGPELRARALGLLHSLHGKNPLDLVYLSNMESYGAERSVTQFFHTWFRDGHPDFDSTIHSRLGPAPGYLVGGPSLEYCEGERFVGHLCRRTSIRHLAPLRRYVDENTGFSPSAPYDSTWELSENGIYYQAAYIALVSAFQD